MKIDAMHVITKISERPRHEDEVLYKREDRRDSYVNVCKFALLKRI